MKKIIGAFLMAGTLVTGAFAEGGILVGGGITLPSMKVSGAYLDSIPVADLKDFSTSMSTGIKADWYYWYAFNERITVITGANIETRGGKVSYVVDDSVQVSNNRSLIYAHIPVMLSFSLLPEIVPGVLGDLAVSGGPEVGFLLKRGKDAEQRLQTLDYGARANLSITLFDRFVVGAGYSLSLPNVKKPYEASYDTGEADNDGNAIFETKSYPSSHKNSAIVVFIDYKFTAGR